MMYPTSLVVASINLVRWLDTLPYQVVGLCVLFTGVGLVWMLLEGISLVLRWWDLGQAVPPPEKVLPLPPSVPVLQALPPSQPPPPAGAVPPEVLVVISAAVQIWIEEGAHIVSIVPVESIAEQVHQRQAWSSEGRRQHFASHKVR